MLPEHAFPGRRVRLTKSPYPELHDGHVARRGTIRKVVMRQNGCLVLLDGFPGRSGFGFGFSEMELLTPREQWRPVVLRALIAVVLALASAAYSWFGYWALALAAELFAVVAAVLMHRAWVAEFSPTTEREGR